MWKAGEGRVIGIGVTSLTKQLAAHYGVESGASDDNVAPRSFEVAAQQQLLVFTVVDDEDSHPIN